LIVVNFEKGIFNLSGNLTYHNVPQLLEMMKNHNWSLPIKVDFTNVNDIDTSLLSVIFEIQRQAKKNNTNVALVNIPDNLKVLAKLYGVEEYLIQNN